MMRSGSRAISCTLLVFAAIAIAPSPSTAANKSAEGAPPPADAITTLDFSGELQWYYRNDLGIVLVYADDRLYRLDLLADDLEPPEPLDIPGLTEERSVLPVARTGLILIPNAPLEGRPPGSYAIDTLSGKIVWRAGALPGIDFLFSFPDAGLAVVRSHDDGGRLIAIDLVTGKRVWEITKWARLIWTDAPYLRAVVGNDLLTLDVHTGETVRQDKLTLPKSKRLHVYPEEGVFLLWNNKNFTGYSVPPIPPATAAATRQLWKFKAASLMVDACIKIGNCRIRRVGNDLLFVRSATRNELVRLTTGEPIVNVKKGFWGAPVSVSPSGSYVAYAAGESMRILDGDSGDVVHEIEYPAGREGMKTLRHMSWPSNDLVMTVFPDKKGNPRKMTGFSCSEGSLVWTTVLPDVADYLLTSEQRAKLAGRIMSSLVMTAVSAANPISVGGDSYYVVFVPNLNVSESFAAGVAPTSDGKAGGEPPFAAAMERYAECERRIAAKSETTRYFVVGPKGTYDILKIDLVGGGVDPVRRYEADKVHAITPFTAFERALTLENDHRRVRLLRLD